MLRLCSTTFGSNETLARSRKHFNVSTTSLDLSHPIVHIARSPFYRSSSWINDLVSRSANLELKLLKTGDQYSAILYLEGGHLSVECRLFCLTRTASRNSPEGEASTLLLAFSGKRLRLHFLRLLGLATGASTTYACKLQVKTCSSQKLITIELRERLILRKTSQVDFRKFGDFRFNDTLTTLV